MSDKTTSDERVVGSGNRSSDSSSSFFFFFFHTWHDICTDGTSRIPDYYRCHKSKTRMIPFATSFLLSSFFFSFNPVSCYFAQRKRESESLKFFSSYTEIIPESYPSLASTFNPRIYRASPFSELSYFMYLCTLRYMIYSSMTEKTRQCIFSLKVMSRNRSYVHYIPCSFNVGDMPDRLHYRYLSHNVSLTYTECIFLPAAFKSRRILDVIAVFVRAIVIIDRVYDP